MNQIGTLDGRSTNCATALRQALKNWVTPTGAPGGRRLVSWLQLKNWLSF